MIYTIKIPTTKNLILQEFRAVGLDGVFMSGLITLQKGTTQISDWESKLSTLGNIDNVTLVPEAEEIILTFEVSGPVRFFAVRSSEEIPMSTYKQDSLRVRMFQISGKGVVLLGKVYDTYNISRVKSIYYDAANNTQTPEFKDYHTTELFKSGGVTIGNTLRFRFIDSFEGKWSSFRNVLNPNRPPSKALSPYSSQQLTNANIKLRERSNLANLYASQAPTITGIEVFSHNATQDKIVVKADKVCQVVVYVMATDAQFNDTNIQYFSRDSLAYAKEHTYFVPKFAGTNKVIAIPAGDSYYRDFSARTAVNALNTYNYSTAQLVVSRYEEGLTTGKKQAYQDIYTLGFPYGWSFDFGTRTDYGTPTVNAAFMNTIADGQYIKASQDIFTRGATYGFTYNSASTDKSYYLGQQVPFINTLTGAGAIEAYRSMFNRGGAYGYTYDTTQTDKTYYQAQEPAFVAKVDATSRAAGYKLAYSELFTAGRAYQGSAGLPEGGVLWVDDTATNVNFASKKAEFIRHIYNAGYVRAKQETFDRGIPYGYNFRNFMNVNSKVLSDASLPSDYYNEGPNFLATVTANAKAEGYKDVYSYINTQYVFSYDSTNSTNLPLTQYVSYLSDLKAAAVLRVNTAARIGAYNNVYGHMANEYKFVYNNLSQDLAYYTGLVDTATSQVYNYGTRAAYQNVFDYGTPYNFLNLTTYGQSRDVTYTLKPSKNDATTTYFTSISETFTNAVRDYGSVFTFKRFFVLGVQYGFEYDANQTSLNYFDNKREEFLSLYSAGNYSEGMRTVYESAKNKYGFEYTFAPNKAHMDGQLTAMETWVANKSQSDAYKYALTELNTSKFYSIPFTDSNSAQTLRSQLIPNLNSMKNLSALEAYNYVVTTANSRTGYTIPLSTSASVMQGHIIPMFKYVEDYMEADAYRRVHNYAKNFLNIGYTFNDSTDPRVLENQVPDLFDFLNRNGGFAAYKYVHDTAASMFGWTYYNDWTVGTLKNQVIPMFNFIQSSYEDIESISQPTFVYPNSLSFDVVLKRNASIVAVLIDRVTHTHVGTYSSIVKGINHKAKFQVPASAFDKPIDIMVIPSARGT